MKRILTAAFAFLLLGTAAIAQSKEHGQNHKMQQELGLTDEQKAEMKRIREAEKNELEALKKDTKLSKEEAIAARKAIHEKYKTQFKNVLTEDQQKKAAEMRKHDGDHHDKDIKSDSGHYKKGGSPKNAIGKQPDGKMPDRDHKNKMDEELNLSAEQKNRIAANREEFKAKADAIKNDAKLTRGEKQEAMKALAEKQREEMRSILTEEQRRKMAEKRNTDKKKGK